MRRESPHAWGDAGMAPRTIAGDHQNPSLDISSWAGAGCEPWAGSCKDVLQALVGKTPAPSCLRCLAPATGCFFFSRGEQQ